VCEAASLQFIKGVNESTVPDVSLRRARTGTSGQAMFTFENPSIFQASSELGDITGEAVRMSVLCFVLFLHRASSVHTFTCSPAVQWGIQPAPSLCHPLFAAAFGSVARTQPLIPRHQSQTPTPNHKHLALAPCRCPTQVCL
jgi:hypothetical protein